MPKGIFIKPMNSLRPLGLPSAQSKARIVERSEQSGDVHRELHDVRNKLIKAETKAEDALKARNVSDAKVEEAQAHIAELERQLEVMNNVNASLGKELAHEDKLLSKAYKVQTKNQNALNVARAQASFQERKAAEQENERVAEKNQAVKLKMEVAATVEENARLLRELNSMKMKQTALKKRLNESLEIEKKLRHEGEIGAKRLQQEEEAHFKTRGSLAIALRQLGDAERANQAAQSSASETSTLKREIQHLRKELLREQGVIAQQEAQIQAHAKARESSLKIAESCTVASTSATLAERERRQIDILQRRLLLQSKELEETRAASQSTELPDFKNKSNSGLAEVPHYRSELLKKERNLRAMRGEVHMLRGQLEQKSSHGNCNKVAVQEVAPVL